MISVLSSLVLNSSGTGPLTCLYIFYSILHVQNLLCWVICSSTLIFQTSSSVILFYFFYYYFFLTVADFIFLGSKITADGDCSHAIKRRLLLWRKVMTNLDSILKSRDITLSTKVHLVKAMVFPVVMYGCGSWTVGFFWFGNFLFSWFSFNLSPYSYYWALTNVFFHFNSLQEFNILILKCFCWWVAYM